MAETIKIGGELESMATGKIVAAASAIKDKTRNKTQETINGDVERAFSEQSEQFQRLSEETAESVSSAENAARQSKQYLADLKEAITDLPDGQAVSAQVAINQVDIAGLKSDIVVDLYTRYNTSYANLSAALTALNSDTATDASAIKKGGVSIKFINSSTNKHEQWNLKASSWSTNVGDWALDVDSSITNGKLKLPFELEKPSSNEYVTQASEIGMDGQPMSEVVPKTANTSPSTELDISDENGYSVARFSGGHIKTKNFDSKTTPSQGMAPSSDLDITDEQGNAVVRFANGHVRTKEFDSREVPKEGMAPSSDLDITDEQGNVIVRFANGHIRTKEFDSSKKSSGGGSGSWAFLKIRDYTEVLTMDPDDVVNIVETVSNGKFTAIYDDAGYPSLMYKIPIMSIGMLDSDLGDFVTPHPAFVVNGVAKPYIYISVYMTSSYEGHYVSWWGLKPLGSTSHSALRSTIMSKGAGWHLETIYERSLLSNLARKLNDEQIHCNSYWGCNYHNKAESCEMANGKLPGKTNQSNGAKWINGTQPAMWSHDKTVWGIQDVCGGYHEIVDLIKTINGQIFLAADNDWTKESAQYSATGIYYDWNSNMPILSNSMTSSYPGQEGKFITSDYTTFPCSSGYDTLSEALRKKMVLLGLSPRLSSSSPTKYNYRGKIGLNTDVNSHYIFGGAEEYNYTGLGYYIAAYDTDVYTHNNMGSRICFIK